jgi:hypothetical protein
MALAGGYLSAYQSLTPYLILDAPLQGNYWGH